jgi:hypothetical protein
MSQATSHEPGGTSFRSVLQLAAGFPPFVQLLSIHLLSRTARIMNHSFAHRHG